MNEPPLWLLGVVIIAALIAFFAGANSERKKQLRARQDEIDKAEEISDDIGALPPNVRREQLKKWK